MKWPTLVGGAIILALLVAAVIFSLRDPRVISTPISGLKLEAPLQVGPLAVAADATLVIVTPELHARIDTGGVARLYHIDPERPPDQSPTWITVALGEAGWNKFLLDLGQLKAAWTMRTVGEAAVAPPPDTPSAVILVEEEAPGGERRNRLRLRPEDPEYEELRRILTPLRIGR